MKTIIRNLCLIATAVIGPNLILAVTEARAALQYYEGFNYPSGELLSMQPGWGGGTANVYTIGNGSLVFGTLQTRGNRVVVNQPTGATSQAETFIPPIGANGTTTWISFLLRPEAIDSIAGSRLTLSLDATLSIGLGIADTNYSIEGFNGFNPVASSTPAIVGTTVLLVVEAEFNPLASGNDTFMLFVNPTPGLSAPDVAGVTKSDLNVQSSINTLFLIANEPRRRELR